MVASYRGSTQRTLRDRRGDIQVNEPLAKVIATDAQRAEIGERQLREIAARSAQLAETASRHANFRRIAEPRVEIVLKGLDNLAPLADRSRYPVRDVDIDALETVLVDRVTALIEMFRLGRGRVAGFRFPNGDEDDTNGVEASAVEGAE